MSAYNPFRARNPDGSSAGATASFPISDDQTSPDLFSKPAPPPVSFQRPNGHSQSAPSSLDLETDDSTSSDEPAANPFNADPAVSENDQGSVSHDENTRRRSSTSSTLNDRPLAGTAPHSALSAVESTASLLSTEPSSRTVKPEFESGLVSVLNTPQESVSPTVPRPGRQKQVSRSQPEQGSNRSPSSRSNKEKKPPPPPRSHHGKRITTTSEATATAVADASSSSFQPSPPRSTNRHSSHASSPESQVSTRRSEDGHSILVIGGARPEHPGSSVYSDGQQRARALDLNSPAESVRRSTSQHSQHKRPPTPPLSRRHSQMRRSKSTQSQSSGTRLTMSSRDSESTDSSQPSSPGPSTRSLASKSDPKRLSMPPPASFASRDREQESRGPGPSLSPDSIPSPPATTRSTPFPPSRRASSYGATMAGGLPSSATPPPPPPPRRARDSSSRHSDGRPVSRPVSQVIGVEEAPFPQPSNAEDILADLSRLQKEVDDLRGHYENRKVSQ